MKPNSEGVDRYQNVYHGHPLLASTKYGAAFPTSLVPVIIVTDTLYPHHGPVLLHNDVLLVNTPAAASHPTHRKKLQQGWQEYNHLLGLNLGILTTSLQ